MQTSSFTKDEIKPLTGLRGFAAIWVFLLHACFGNVNQFGYFPAFDHKIDWGFMQNFILQGYLAVDLFFILSGFIMAYTYVDRFQSSITKVELKRFFIKRIARVYPVHAFLTILLAGFYFSGLWETIRPMDLDDVILSMTLTNVMQEPSVNMPAWSISAEWFAYLLCPAILWVTAKWNGKKLNIFLLGSICILYPLLFHKFLCCSGIVGTGAILRVFSGFIAGILLHKLYRDQFLFSGKKIFSDWIGFGALIVIYILITLKTDFSLIYPFLIVFVYSLAICRSYLRNIFASKTMLFLGTISYCIYMVHYAVLEIFSVFLSDYLYTTEASQALYWLILLSMSAILITAASILYFLLEKPVRTWMTKASLK